MTTAIELQPAIVPEVCRAIGMVGRVVTVQDRQYKIHSVEGGTWYAFEQKDGTIKVDLDFPMVQRFENEPMAAIIPMGSVMGDGFHRVVPFRLCSPGVCLTKWWDLV